MLWSDNGLKILIHRLLYLLETVLIEIHSISIYHIENSNKSLNQAITDTDHRPLKLNVFQIDRKSASSINTIIVNYTPFNNNYNPTYNVLLSFINILSIMFM